MRKYVIALLLALTLAVILTTLAKLLIPGIYGSCFEGSCGYMQGFIVIPIVTLILLVPLSLIVERLGPVLQLMLLFPLAWLFGSIAFDWVGGGYGVPLLFLYLGYRSYQKNQSAGGKLRDLFISRLPSPSTDKR